MFNFWITGFIYFQAIGLSLQVIISPCKVENMLTQPLYGTSLARKAIVQIIQIPPVFTQNVMIGKCINANLESPGSPAGDYFVCRQRYSSVEVYIADQDNRPHTPNQNGSVIQSPMDKFRSTNFVRDTVVVESGCDFTFNLLPLLLRHENKGQLQTHNQQSQNHHFLQSPYHLSHPEHISLPPISNTNITYPSQKGYVQQVHFQQNQPNQNYNIQGGNGSNREKGGIISVNHPVINHNFPGAPPPVSPQGYKARERDDLGENEYLETKIQGESSEDSRPGDKAYVYPLSDKIGVPLYILSREFDPLLNNIGDGGSY